jgi:hypothetical protein
MRVLVCGGRNYRDKERVWEILDRVCNPENKPLPEGVTIIHGGAWGADWLADHWAVHNLCAIEEYPANWEKHGKAAGPIRNLEMLNEAKPDLVVAFPGGRGTAHMVRIAKEAGVQVIEIDNNAG